jgi:hypothetical protein
MLDAGIDAVSCDALTKVVVRGLPFQLITEVETNPAPFTVKVKLAPPGAAVSGTRGWLTNGIGFCAIPGAAKIVVAKSVMTIRKT